MKKENAFMVLFVLLITILIVLLCVAPVFAQDEMPPEEEPIEEPIDEPVEEEPVEVDPWEGIEAPLGDCIGNGCGEPIEFIVEGCVKYPLAMNWLGPQSDWEGWTMVDDGSCFCMDIVLDEWGNVLSLDEVDCGKANNSFNDWMAWDYNQNLLPDETAYFEMIDIEGCTDPKALNYMDPVWWEGFNIIEDGSCYYEEEIYIPNLVALEWN